MSEQTASLIREDNRDYLRCSEREQGESVRRQHERRAARVGTLDNHLRLRLDEMAEEEKHLRAYLPDKINRADWHGVSDAANDLRDIVAEREALHAVKALLA